MKRFYQILLIFVCLLVFEFSTFAQPSSIVTPTPTPTPPTESEARKLETDIEDVFRIKKRKSSVSNPGDFGDVGVLNIGYSYGGYYRGQGFRSQDTGTLTLDFAATEKIGIDYQIDMIASQKISGFPRTSGYGDSRITVQIDVLDEGNTSPAFAVSYFVKFPSASVIKGSAPSYQSQTPRSPFHPETDAPIRLSLFLFRL